VSNQIPVWLALILSVIGGVFYIARLEASVGENTSDIKHQREVIELKLEHIVSELKSIKAQTAQPFHFNP